MTETDYQAALDWLFAQTRGGRERSVSNMQALVAALDLQVPARVAHVVGTNGKGTVSAMIARGLEAEQIRTGLFISPHVVDYRERISVNGRQIDKADVIRFCRRVRELDLPPAAFFELSLALALEHFAQEQVAFLVLEAGVGARSDATMAVGNTVVTVMTSIALDHTATLGDSIRLITEDKAAAIRPGVPVVTAATGEALEVVRAVAADRGSPLLHPARDPDLFRVPVAAAATGTRLLNQRLAAATLRLLGASEATGVTAGTSRPPLPARGERFSVMGRTVLLDGAHDPAAAAELVRELAPGYTLLYAGLGRKQRLDTCRVLATAADQVFSTALEPEEPLDWPGAVLIADNQVAFRAALESTPTGGLLLVAGSLYLAGHLRESILELAQP